jgi:hypothetical protein
MVYEPFYFPRLIEVSSLCQPGKQQTSCANVKVAFDEEHRLVCNFWVYLVSGTAYLDVTGPACDDDDDDSSSNEFAWSALRRWTTW